MSKTEVYSWRLSPTLKARLEEAAHAERKSLAELLQQIAEEWLRLERRQELEEEERQGRLLASAMKFVGSLEGGNPDRATDARAEIRSRLRQKHAR